MARAAAWVLASLALSWPGWALPQQLGDQVAEPVPPQAAPVEGEGAPAMVAELEKQLEEAEKVFFSARQPEASGLLDELIERLAQPPAGAETRAAEMLERALTLRAEVAFNLGDEASSLRDLGELLRRRPGFALDPQAVSPKFMALLDQRRAELVGELSILVAPLDARIALGERELGAAEGIVPVLAGSYTVRIERPGYGPVERELVVPAGQRVELQESLERTGAVVRLVTVPGGVETQVDGVWAGTTEEAEGSLTLDGLVVGRHELTLERPGYRPRTVNLELDALADYTLEAIVLEPTRGTVSLRGVPRGATLRVNGEPLALDEGSAGLELPPGDYRLEVEYPLIGSFDHRLSLADREQASVEVVLRPTVALVGVAAPGAAQREALTRSLDDALGSVEGWLYQDRIEDGARVFRELEIAPDDLAGIASGEVTVSWQDLQSALDRQVAAALYLVAVANEELTEGTPEIWLGSPAPAPPAPTRWSQRPAASGTIDGLVRELAEELARPTRLEAVSLGATLMDSPLAQGPVVAAVDPSGAAAAAGLAVGDRIAAIGGSPVADRRQILDSLEALAGGETATVAVQRGEAAEERTLPVRREPWMPWPSRIGPEAPITRARLRLDLATARPDAPAWLLQLQEAALLLSAHRWSQAADLLRTIEAPKAPGLGRGAVDYWLGVALAAQDPESQAARRAFERAAGDPQATVCGAGCARVSVRARARLRASQPR